MLLGQRWVFLLTPLVLSVLMQVKPQVALWCVPSLSKGGQLLPAAEALVCTGVTWDIASVHSPGPEDKSSSKLDLSWFSLDSLFTQLRHRLVGKKNNDLHHQSWGVTFNTVYVPVQISE